MKFSLNDAGEDVGVGVLIGGHARSREREREAREKKNQVHFELAKISARVVFFTSLGSREIRWGNC